MKTNKEFLDGIYKKAEYAKIELKERKETQRNLPSFFRWNKVVPALSLCMVILIALPIGIRHWKKSQIIEENNNLMALYSNETITDTPSIAIQQRNSLQMQETLLLYGTINRFEDLGDQVNLTLSIEDIYQGEWEEDSEEILIYVTGEDIWFETKEHETKILCYLMKSESGYELNNGDYSIYLYEKEENQEIIFMAKDGSTISSAILCQDME